MTTATPITAAFTDKPAAPADHAPPHEDNMFGICAALGEDFGFNPLWLRIAFGVALLFSLEITLAVYAGLGVVVLASRLLFPNGKRRITLPAHEPWAPRLADPTPAPRTFEPEPLRQAA